MAVIVQIDHATFNGEVAEAELQNIALSYHDNVENRHGRVYINRDGTNRFKGTITSNLLSQLGLDINNFKEKLKQNLSLPTPVRVDRIKDQNGLAVSVTEYYHV